MRKRTLEIVLIFTALLVLGVLIAWLASFVLYKPDYSCSESLQTMFINVDSFPDGWQMDEPRTDDMYGIGLIDYCGVGYLVVNGVANQRTYEYKSIDYAKEGYREKLSSEFYSRESLDTPWIEIDMDLKEEIKAEESYLACAEIGHNPMCRFLARYRKYIVLFNSHMEPEFMTARDLEQVIYAIDARMTQEIMGGN
jgi:hypothetical protein